MQKRAMELEKKEKKSQPEKQTYRERFKHWHGLA